MAISPNRVQAPLSLEVKSFLLLLTFVFFFKFILFLEKGEGRDKERERNINVRLLLACPLLGNWPTTQACALTGIEPETLGFSGQHSVH